jgi:hypothetical protein
LVTRFRGDRRDCSIKYSMIFVMRIWPTSRFVVIAISKNLLRINSFIVLSRLVLTFGSIWLVWLMRYRLMTGCE